MLKKGPCCQEPPQIKSNLNCSKQQAYTRIPVIVFYLICVLLSRYLDKKIAPKMAHKRGYPTYDRFMHVIGLTALVSLGDPKNTNNILDSADIKFKTSIKDSWIA